MMIKEITAGVYLYRSEIKRGAIINVELEVENQLLYNVRVNFDFSGSKHVKFKDQSNSLYKEALVPPKQSRKVITLILEGNWIISSIIK